MLLNRNLKVPGFVSLGPVEWGSVPYYNDYPMPPGLIKPDVCAFPGRDTVDIIRQTLRVIAGAHLRSTAVIHRRVRRLEVQSDTPLPVLLDGDFYPVYPTIFEVASSALTVMVPRHRLPLFRRRPLSR